jgi:predicted dehydrogenase
MRIGVIGLGSIGARHVRNMQALYPRATVEVLTQRKSWEEAGPSIRLIASPAAFFKTKHEVYFITNETIKHTATLRRVLKQKPKGIFIEKPLSHNLSGLKEIQIIAKRQGTVVFVGYNLQFFKPLVILKKLIKKKTIGDVQYIRASVGQDLRLWRKGDYRAHYSAHNNKGGGVVLDLIHDLNYPAWLIDEPLTLLAGHAGVVSLPISAEDIAESILRSPSGVVVSVHQDPGRRYCEVVGAKGTLVWEWMLGETSLIHINTSAVKRTMHIREDSGRMYIEEVKWFMKKVAEGNGYSNFEEAIQDVNNAEQIKKH